MFSDRSPLASPSPRPMKSPSPSVRQGNHVTCNSNHSSGNDIRFKPYDLARHNAASPNNAARSRQTPTPVPPEHNAQVFFKNIRKSTCTHIMLERFCNNTVVIRIVCVFCYTNLLIIDFSLMKTLQSIFCCNVMLTRWVPYSCTE